MVKRTISKTSVSEFLTQRRTKVSYRPTKEEIEAKIREKAYSLFEKRGCAHGHDWEDWMEAERIVTKELAKQ